MSPIKLCAVFIVLSCFQVSLGQRSLKRVEKRLDKLEEELFTERRHLREDVNALTDQLESLRQTCGCDTSKPVTPGQELSKSKNAKETSFANVEPSLMASLRMAFKQEKEVNERLRSGLVQTYARVEGDLKQTLMDVTKNVTETKQELISKHNELIQNVTRVITVTNNTLSAHMSDSARSLESFKVEINNKIVDEVNSVKTDMAETERELMDLQSIAIEELSSKHNEFIQNVTRVLEATNQTLSAHMSDTARSLGSLKDEMDNKIADMVNNVKTDMAETERELVDLPPFAIDNMTENEVQSMSQILSTPESVVDSLFVVENCPRSNSASGVYLLRSSLPILDNTPVYCDTTTDGGGWIVFQRRQDGSVDFFRTWNEYKEGFGSPSSEFWWGLERLHAATHNKPRELRIDLEDFSGNKVYAHYTSFSIASESDTYALSVSGYSGTAGDGLAEHNGKPFTTKDRDHDTMINDNGAVRWTGAWWFGYWIFSHLNGKYVPVGGSSNWGKGPVWDGFIDWKALKFTEMKIR